MQGGGASDMNCKRAKDLILLDYADGALKGHVLEELESHILSCPSCRRLAEDVAYTGRLFESAGRAEAPMAVWNRIRSELAGLPRANGFIAKALDRIRSGLYDLRPAIVATAAVAMLVFVLMAARIISDINYNKAISARDDTINMISLNDDNGKYDMGTQAEKLLL